MEDFSWKKFNIEPTPKSLSSLIFNFLTPDP